MIRSLGLARNDATQVGAGVQSPRELGRSPLIGSYGLWSVWESGQRRRSVVMCFTRKQTPSTDGQMCLDWEKIWSDSPFSFIYHLFVVQNRVSHFRFCISSIRAPLPSLKNIPSYQSISRTPPVKGQEVHYHRTIDINNLTGLHSAWQWLWKACSWLLKSSLLLHRLTKVGCWGQWDHSKTSPLPPRDAKV